MSLTRTVFQLVNESDSKERVLANALNTLDGHYVEDAVVIARNEGVIVCLLIAVEHCFVIYAKKSSLGSDLGEQSSLHFLRTDLEQPLDHLLPGAFIIKDINLQEVLEGMDSRGQFD